MTQVLATLRWIALATLWALVAQLLWLAAMLMPLLAQALYSLDRVLQLAAHGVQVV
jgi:hypothetical protein